VVYPLGYNVFTEGAPFSEAGYVFPGYHQVKEAGDFARLAEDITV